jgi:hypothetical protein
MMSRLLKVIFGPHIVLTLIIALTQLILKLILLLIDWEKFIVIDMKEMMVSILL